MADLTQNIASYVWIALGIIIFVRLRQWNKKFEALYAELKRQVEEDV